MNDYKVPNGKKYKNWEEVFANSQPIKFTAFNTGRIYGALKTYTQVESLPDDCDPDDTDFPYAVMAFHFHHQVHGDIMIDAGFDRSFSDNPPFGNLPISMKLFQTLNKIKYTQQEEEDYAFHLEKHQLQPQHVFLTHMHADHNAGAAALSSNINIYYGKQEHSFYYRRLATPRVFSKMKNVNLLDFDEGVSLAPFDKVLDVFGDGTFWAISTPGHTKDHIAYLINREHSPVLITGDAELTKWGMENGVFMGSDYGQDGEQDAQHSAQMIRTFHQQYPQVEIWFSHDEQCL